jgi:hypothetical protein
MNNTDYTKYPWDRLKDRHDAGVQYLYQQNAHIFSEHLYYCEECSTRGLCSTGAQYNKICRDLEKQVFED